MGEYVFLSILFVLVIASFLFARHMDKVFYESILDKKVVINNYREYFKLYIDYHYSSDRITSIEELNISEQELIRKIKWFNNKYRLYGYYIAPESLLFTGKEENYGCS